MRWRNRCLGFVRQKEQSGARSPSTSTSTAIQFSADMVYQNLPNALQKAVCADGNAVACFVQSSPDVRVSIFGRL